MVNAAEVAPGRKFAQVSALTIEEGASAEPGAAPDLRWIPLEDLVVSGEYQREVLKRGRAIVRRACADFSWSRFKALNVLDLGDGRFEICDGQHSAAILASLGGVKAAPCLVCGHAGLAAAAADFVAINTTRTNLTSLQVHRAGVVAGDPVAKAVAAGAEQAGVRIPNGPPQKKDFRPAETWAIAALRRVAAAKGAAGLARLLKIGVEARLAPIDGTAIDALAILLWDHEFKGARTDAALAEAIRTGGERLRDAADIARLETGQPLKRALAIEVFRESGRRIQ